MSSGSDGQRRVFHDGERAVQRRYGVDERLAEVGPSIVRDHMPADHRELFERLPTLLVGSLDASGQPWASMLAGWPGFVHAQDERHLRIDRLPDAADPLHAALAEGAPVGLLGLEPETRRRNRMNGRVARVEADGFVVRVQQSFGNCPQYIQARRPEWTRDPSDHSPLEAEALGSLLDEEARRVIAAADTFFIASASSGARGGEAAEGVDVSHRGGRPGFVAVRDDDDVPRLLFPDFRGNFLFNTLGNLEQRPQAGLLFVDYGRGDLLQLAGQARVLWSGPEVETFAGAQRVVAFSLERALRRTAAIPLRWSSPRPASQLAGTGSWSSR